METFDVRERRAGRLRAITGFDANAIVLALNSTTSAVAIRASDILFEFAVA